MRTPKRNKEPKKVETIKKVEVPFFVTPANYIPKKEYVKHIEPEVQEYIKEIDEETKETHLIPNGKTNIAEKIQAELPNVMTLGESVERYQDGYRPKGGYNAANYQDTTNEPRTRAELKKQIDKTNEAKAKLEQFDKEQQAIINREKTRQEKTAAKATAEKDKENK